MGRTQLRRDGLARLASLVCAVRCATLVAVASACGAFQSPLDRGQAITSEPPSLALTWTGDDSEIVFSVAPRTGESLKAYRVSDGTERTLDSGKRQYLAVLSRPGSDVFFVADVSSSADVVDARLFAASSRRELASLQELAAFAVAPDAQRIAIGRGQADAIGTPTSAQTFVLDLASGSSTELVPCRVPRLFSPDGSRILCDTSADLYVGNLKPAIIDIASGTATPLPEKFATAEVIWTSSGLRAVYRSDTNSGAAVVEDATTGPQTGLNADEAPGTILLDSGFWPPASPPTWSPDGTHVAFWKEECHDSEPVCDRRVRLVVADVARASSRVVAVGSDVGGPIAFSNDARRIGYVLDYALRMRNLE